jgi:DNA polymerase I-like protein with 3'-5' exonuclease and polymerase domains
LDATIVKTWLREQLSVAHRDYVFANAQYDLGWLRTLGVEVKGRINDVCIADTLIDEERPEGYSLEALAQRWLGIGKEESVLRAAADNYGINAKADLWKLPANLVGAYGEADPVRTLAIWQKQKPVLHEEGLWQVYELERQLNPILFEMFWRGIRVDTDFGQQLNDRWLKRERELFHLLGGLDIWSTVDVAKLCDKEKIHYPRTTKGNPSITKQFMEASSHPKLIELRELRALQSTRSIYLEQNLLKDVINGRIHPQYIQMASDDGGTRTMRLSCRNPNAQQFPKRSSLFDAKTLRHCLLPEAGSRWAKFDYWSQEPVIQCHYGLVQNLPGAEETAAAFRRGIKLATFVEKGTKGRLNYDQAKAVILGRSYGMGAPKMRSHNEHAAQRVPVAPRRVRPDRAVHCHPRQKCQRRRLAARLHQNSRRPQTSLQSLATCCHLER